MGVDTTLTWTSFITHTMHTQMIFDFLIFSSNSHTNTQHTHHICSHVSLYSFTRRRTSIYASYTSYHSASPILSFYFGISTRGSAVTNHCARDIFLWFMELSL